MKWLLVERNWLENTKVKIWTSCKVCRFYEIDPDIYFGLEQEIPQLTKPIFRCKKKQTKVKRFFNKKGCRRCSGKTWSLWPFPPHFNCVSPFAAIPEGYRHPQSLFLFDIHSWGVKAATQSLIFFLEKWPGEQSFSILPCGSPEHETFTISNLYDLRVF